MPSYANLAKNVLSINSIYDIPEKYRNAVLEKINQKEDNTLYGQITTGEKGSIESSLEQLNMEFNDSSLLYFGHGTPLDSTVDSILITGLKVKNPKKIRAYDSHLRGLDSTTIGFTTGSDSLYSNERNLLDNWPHKESKNIIIVALPINYLFSPIQTRNYNTDLYEQFYIGSEEEGYILRPEFIKGVYDARTHSFTPNKNFYKNLPDDAKERLFNELDDNYIQAYSDKIPVSPDEFGEQLPINSSKIDKLYIEWYTAQLRKLNSYNNESQQSISSFNDSNSEFGGDDWIDDGNSTWDETVYDDEQLDEPTMETGRQK